MRAIMKRLLETTLADALREELSQHLAGTVLAAGALSSRLARRHAPEATEAAYLLDMIKKANRQLSCLIANLNAGKLEDNR
jgi:hypothetical protein